MKKFLFLVAALCCFAPSASAQSRGGSVNSYVQSISATTDAQRVEKNTASPYIIDYTEVRCYNNSTTPVFFGSKTAAVYPLCSDATACPDGIVMSFPVTSLWAKVSSSAVNITCIFLR